MLALVKIVTDHESTCMHNHKAQPYLYRLSLHFTRLCILYWLTIERNIPALVDKLCGR